MSQYKWLHLLEYFVTGRMCQLQRLERQWPSKDFPMYPIYTIFNTGHIGVNLNEAHIYISEEGMYT